MLMDNMMFHGPNAGELITETFTQSGQWTAPAELEKIETVVLRGGDGEPEQTIWSDITRLLVNIPSSTDEQVSLSEANSRAQNEFNKFGSAASSYTVWNYGGSGVSGSTVSLSSIRTKSGGATKIPPPAGVTASNGWGATGTWNPGDSNLRWYVGNIEQSSTQSATTGAATDGFGLNAPGGSGGAASTITETDVAVTPGETYDLSIDGVNAFIEIQYRA